MGSYRKKMEIRWADLDPNFHMRHSNYYDLGAQMRISVFSALGITPEAMRKYHIGPILLREECVFRREILMGDEVEIDIKLLKARHDGSRWTMQHHLYKNGEQLAAVITIDGAWMDLEKRKLAVIPEAFKARFGEIPRSKDFEWSDK